MPTTDKQAQAFENVSELSAKRERIHALRFAYVKLHRACLDVERLLREEEEYTDERSQHFDNIREDAMFQRTVCWKEIERLDHEIQTEVHRLNNGVYDHA